MTMPLRELLRLNPQEAHSLAVLAVKRDRRNVEALFIAAAALRRLGDARGAIDQLTLLLARLEGSWGLHYEIGMAHAAIAAGARAIEHLSRAGRLNPASALVQQALADQLLLAGETAAATGALERSLSLQSGPADRNFIAAIGNAQVGAIDANHPLARQFGFDANDIGWLCVAAETAARLPRLELAEAWIGRALSIAPDFAAGHFRRALVLHRQARDAEALADIELLAADYSRSASVQGLHGAVLLQLGRAEEAVLAYDRALHLDSQGPGVQLALGHALRATGQGKAAVEAYRGALSREPELTEAWWSLANLKTFRFTPADRAAMLRQASGPLDPLEASWLHFALGKTFEDERVFAAAFDHYARANTLRRSITPFDAAAQGAFIDRSVAALAPALFDRPAKEAAPADAPIFVVGLPRSGSTLVEQILASHGEIEGAGELPELTMIARRLAGEGQSYPELLATLPAARLAAIGKDYLERTATRRHGREPRFVDKFPGNWMHIALIRLALPGAAIIDVRREPMACCASLFTHSFAAGQAYCYDLADLGRYYVDYVRYMERVDEVLPGRVLRLSYESLVDHPERETRRMLDHLGLAFDPACLRFFDNPRAVRTPSSEQVRQPVNRDGLDRWRGFAPWLGPLRAALGPLAPD